MLSGFAFGIIFLSGFLLRVLRLIRGIILALTEIGDALTMQREQAILAAEEVKKTTENAPTPGADKAAQPKAADNAQNSEGQPEGCP